MSKKLNLPCEIRQSWRRKAPISQGKLHAIIAVIILLAVFVPWHQAKAGFLDLGLSEMAQAISTLIMGIIGALISWTAQAFNAFIRWQTYSGFREMYVVDQGWLLVRNFVNLFFILALIIMAFGTIFNIRKYTWKEMLAPFLIAALLINFSLAIGVYIITAANGLSGVFLEQIARNGDITEKFAEGFSQANVFTQTPGVGSLTAGVDGLFSVLATMIFGIIWLSIILLAFLAAFIFSIARVFVLWFLLIISPIAWLGYALPNLRQKTWSEWWTNFLGWCFFLPSYLFFLMFAVIFINNKDRFSTLTGSASVTSGSLTLNNVLIYGVGLIFLVYGLAMAKKISWAGGGAASTVFGKIETGVRKYAPGAAYVRGGYAGLKERGAEIQEKGLFGIGGAQKARVAEARAKGWLAPAPTTGEIERRKAEAAEVDKETKKLQTLNLTLDQLNQRLTKGNKFEQVAAFKLKAENGWLDSTDLNKVNETMRSAGGGRTALGASIISSLKKGKFHEMAQTTAQKEFIFDNLEDVEVKKAFGLDMAGSKEVVNEKLAKQLLDLYANDTQEVKDKVEEAVKKNIENFARKKEDRRNILLNPDTDKRIRRMAGGIMIDKKEISDLQSRQTAIDLIGKDTPKGREAIKNIGAFNSLLNIEVKLREERGIPIDQPLSEADNERVLAELKDKLQEKLVKNELKEIKAMSPDFFKDSRFREAAQEVFADPADMTRLVKDAPKDLRIAVKDLPGATRTPRRTT